MRKIAALVLAVVMLGMLVACSAPASSSSADSQPVANSSSQPDGASTAEPVDEKLGGAVLPLTEEPVTIDWLVISDLESLNDKLIIQELARITNINLNIITSPSANIEEKLNALVASKNLPDIVSAHEFMPNLTNKIGPQGALAAVNDYLDVMPNFSKIISMPENDYYLKAYSASDDNCYILHAYNTNRDINLGMLYRKDIFDANGIEPWGSTEEFYQVLKQLKEIYPNSTPFAYTGGSTYFRSMGYSWGGLNQFDMYYDEDDGLWKLSTTDENFKDMLDFTKRCYDEGLYDPEFLTLTLEQWNTKMTQSDQAFVSWGWVDRMNILKVQTAETNPDFDLQYWYPVGPSGKTARAATFGAHSAIVAKGDNAELCMRLLDYLYSEAGSELMSLGIEGVTYTLDPETGMADYIGFEDGVEYGIKDLEEKYGLFNSSIYRTLDRRSVYFNFTEPVQRAQEMMVEGDRISPLDPPLAFSAEDNGTITELKPDLMTKGEEFAFTYVLSGTSADTDALWANWLQTAKSYGEDTMVEIYNRTQQEMYG
ncbi:extracellular solute-binding protein [Ruminococcaceae bacterium OttesenSCG-928-D13]|nr:extracellular solute-binding protein [Ruminococcaceae bacterium OttesenSCG-928-D13]